MNAKNNLQPLSPAAFSDYIKTETASLETLSRAIMFAVNQAVSDGRNKSPINALIRLPIMQTKKAHKLHKIGSLLVSYVGTLAAGILKYNPARGQYDYAEKHDSIKTQPIDWRDVPTFATFYQAHAPGNKTSGKPEAKPVTLPAIAKMMATAIETGIKKTEAMDGLDAVTELLPEFISALANLGVTIQSQPEPLATVGETVGEYTRNASKPETAMAEAPRKEVAPAKLVALAAKYHKGENRKTA